MLERFTVEARGLIVEAQAAARASGYDYIGTQHVLLGAIAQPGLAQRAFTSAGLEYETLKRAGEQLDPPPDDPPSGGQIPFTRAAKKVLDQSMREALNRGHNFIGTVHIAHALLTVDEGPHVSLLAESRSTLATALTAQPIPRKLEGGGSELFPGESTSKRRRTQRQARDARGSTAAISDADAEDLASAVESSQAPGHQEAVPTYRDRPADRDELGRELLAEVLSERLRRVRGENTEAPELSKFADDQDAILVHIHARWGAGKSSLLRLLARQLAESDNPALHQWIVIDFSAWQHQRVAPPWWWLLASLRRDGLRSLRRRSRARAVVFLARDLWWRTWNARAAIFAGVPIAVLAVLLLRTDLLDLGDQSLTGLQAAATAVSAIIALVLTAVTLSRGLGKWFAFGNAPPGARFLQKVHDPLRAAQRRYRFLVDALGDPVAIFIDDLDRCRAEYVVELLEGIQTLFLQRPVTFVVAADRDWLCESYRTVYDAFENAVGDPGRPLGHVFLEKTFQISLEIPPLSVATRDRYWTDLVRGVQHDERPRATKALDKEASKALDKEASSLFAGLATEAEIAAALAAPSSSPEEVEARRRAALRRLSSSALERDLEHTLEPFSHLLEPNPRAMKRLVNAFGVERALRVRSGTNLSREEREQNVLWAIVRLRWPLLAQHLADEPEDVRVLLEPTANPERLPESLRPLADRQAVQDVVRGAGLDVELDANALRKFTGAGRAPSTVGA